MTLLQLYPETGSRPLRGTYLAEGLVEALGDAGSADDAAHTPFVYANFLSTLDGRIATPAASGSGYATPPHCRSDSDWRLFRELQCQADCLLTHSGYLRSLAGGELGDVLSIPRTDDTTYLHQWRKQHKLPAQPRIVVVSRSLDFDVAVLPADKSRVHILTGSDANRDRLQGLQARGWTVTQTRQPGLIDAPAVIALLEDLRIRSVYLQTGPDLLHSMLKHGYVKRLFLTLHLSVVGGEDFLSIVRGSGLQLPAEFQLERLYLENSAARQLFLAMRLAE